MPLSSSRSFPAHTLAVIAALMLISVRATAAVIRYSVDLDGSQATPRNTSPGTGSARADIDEAAHTMRLVITFRDLRGDATAAHVHGPTPTPGSGSALPMTPLPSLPGFPLGVTSGSYDRTFDLTSASSYNPDFITSAGGTVADAEAVLVQSLAEGRVLFNLHTSEFATGEIAGFFGQGTVPTEDVSWGALRSLYRGPVAPAPR
jgi:hypothetical protein